MLVVVLDGKLSLIAPDAANPYVMRTILESTDNPQVFLMRSTGAFATDAFGEPLTFDTGADGQILGYRTPYLRYTRLGPLQ
jgi:hypothetical protein